MKTSGYLDVQSEHRPDDLLQGGLRDSFIHRILSPSKDHHPVCDGKDGLESVGDKDDRDPLRLEIPDDVMNLFHFLDRQSGGGFIHNDDSRVEEEGPSNGNGLSLSAGEVIDLLSDGVEMDL